MNEEKKFHWFALSFVHCDCGSTTYTSTYVGREENLVTLKSIDAAKRDFDIAEGAVLIGSSYLGYGTTEDMQSKD